MSTNVYRDAVKINSTRDLGSVVRGRRIGLGLTQADLATRAGVSRPWISSVEAGKPTAEFGRIIRLVDALGLSLRMELAGDHDATLDLDALLNDYESQ